MPELPETHQDAPVTFDGCPYFGLPKDPTTKLLFPSPDGTCHGTKRPVTIDVEYQKGYCLSANHRHCPVFVQADAGDKPADLKLQKGFWVNESTREWPSRGVRVLVAAVAIVVFVAFGAWMFGRESGVPAFAQPDTAVATEEPAARVAGIDGDKATPTAPPTRAATATQPAAAAAAEEATATVTAGATASTTPPASPPALATTVPTALATTAPTALPTASPTALPTASPTELSAAAPTELPTASPSATRSPTARATQAPTATATAAATNTATPSATPGVPPPPPVGVPPIGATPTTAVPTATAVPPTAPPPTATATAAGPASPTPTRISLQP